MSSGLYSCCHGSCNCITYQSSKANFHPFGYCGSHPLCHGGVLNSVDGEGITKKDCVVFLPTKMTKG
eukprot:CCRYP_014831-RA/>CCRYP_014831-RA protein AED:0.43 eAED:0.43 QI:13/1/1/1/0/0/2/272/66